MMLLSFPLKDHTCILGGLLAVSCSICGVFRWSRTLEETESEQPAFCFHGWVLVLWNDEWEACLHFCAAIICLDNRTVDVSHEKRSTSYFSTTTGGCVLNSVFDDELENVHSHQRQLTKKPHLLNALSVFPIISLNSVCGSTDPCGIASWLAGCANG